MSVLTVRMGRAVGFGKPDSGQMAASMGVQNSLYDFDPRLSDIEDVTVTPQTRE